MRNPQLKRRAEELRKRRERYSYFAAKSPKYRLTARSKYFLEQEGALGVFRTRNGLLIAIFPDHTRLIECARTLAMFRHRARRRLEALDLPPSWRAQIHLYGDGHPMGDPPQVETVNGGDGKNRPRS